MNNLHKNGIAKSKICKNKKLNNFRKGRNKKVLI